MAPAATFCIGRDVSAAGLKGKADFFVAEPLGHDLGVDVVKE
jgi:hypothetical protein